VPASKTGTNKAFDDGASSIESARQVAIVGATQSAINGAEITAARALYKLAIANNISPSVFSQALFALGVRS
jgi:hypothetical protein